MKKILTLIFLLVSLVSMAQYNIIVDTVDLYRGGEIYYQRFNEDTLFLNGDTIVSGAGVGGLWQHVTEHDGDYLTPLTTTDSVLIDGLIKYRGIKQAPETGKYFVYWDIADSVLKANFGMSPDNLIIDTIYISEITETTLVDSLMLLVIEYGDSLVQFINSDVLQDSIFVDYVTSVPTRSDGWLSNTDTIESYKPTLGFLTEGVTGLEFSPGTPRSIIGGSATLIESTGYSIPTDVQIGNWNTAYGWGDHAGLYFTKADSNTNANATTKKYVDDLHALQWLIADSNTNGNPSTKKYSDDLHALQWLKTDSNTNANPATKKYVDDLRTPKYIVQQSTSELPNEQATGSLATGIIKNTTTTGVLSIATAGVDYIESEVDGDITNELDSIYADYSGGSEEISGWIRNDTINIDTTNQFWDVLGTGGGYMTIATINSYGGNLLSVIQAEKTLWVDRWTGHTYAGTTPYSFRVGGYSKLDSTIIFDNIRYASDCDTLLGISNDTLVYAPLGSASADTSVGVWTRNAGRNAAWLRNTTDRATFGSNATTADVNRFIRNEGSMYNDDTIFWGGAGSGDVEVHAYDGTLYTSDAFVLGGSDPTPVGVLNVIQNKTTSDLLYLSNDADATKDSTVVVNKLGRGMFGTTTSYAKLTVLEKDASSTNGILVDNQQSTTTFTSAYNCLAMVNSDGTTNSWAKFSFGDNADGTAISTSIGTQFIDPANNYGDLHFYTRGSDGLLARMFVGSDGNVGIGTTSPLGVLDVAKSNASSGLYVTNWDDGTTYPFIQLQRSDNDAIGTLSETDNNDYLGFITFRGIDSGSNVDDGALITVQQRGTSGTKVPSYMSFSTSGRNTLNANALTIDTSGKVGIGTTSPAEKLNLHNSSAGSTAYMRVTNDGTGTGATDGFNVGINSIEEALLWNFENTTMKFATNNSLAMTIQTNGEILSIPTYNNDNAAAGRDVSVLSTGDLGYISSRREVKERIKPMENIGWLYKVTPYNFVYKTDSAKWKMYGFIAEDVDTINKWMVSYDYVIAGTTTGTVTAGDTLEVNPMTVTKSRFIAPLVKSAQDQQKELDALYPLISISTITTEIIESSDTITINDTTGIPRSALASTIYFDSPTAVDFTAGYKQIANGQYDGQEIMIVGTSNANKLTLDQNDNLKLNGGASVVLGKFDNIKLKWFARLNNWGEISRSDN